MGPFLFFPALETTVSHNDNLFLRAEDPVSANIFEIGPNLVWRLPLSRSRFDVAWRPRYRIYEEDVIPDTNTSLFDADLELRFRNGTVLEVKDAFERGILEFQDVAGGEQTFAGQSFTSNQFDMGYLMPVAGRNDIRTGLFSTRTKFDERGGRQFFDQDSRGVSLSWIYRFTEDLAWRTDLRWGDNRLDRSLVLTFDLATGDPIFIESVAAEDADERSVQTGLTGKVGQWLETNTSFGYGVMLFEDAAGQDFRGFIINSDTRFALGRSLQVRLRLQRRSIRSSFNVANFFINENIGVWLEWRSPRRLTLTVGYMEQENSYKDPIVTDLDSDPTTGRDIFGNDVLPDPDAGFVAGVLRTDRISRLEARANFVFIEDRFSFFVRYLDEDRTSNLAFGVFQGSNIQFGLRFGWLASGSDGI